RLLDVPLGAHLQAPDRVLLLALRRDDDDRDRLVRGFLLDALQELETVHDRHVDVEQDEVDSLLLSELVQSLEPVHGADALAVLLAREKELVHLVDQRGIVAREDLPEHVVVSLPRPTRGAGAWVGGTRSEPVEGFYHRNLRRSTRASQAGWSRLRPCYSG